MAEISDVLRDNLTTDQFNAASDTALEIQCLACAGSGKSRTLAFTAARLIAEGANPRSMVAFTFTDKAAESIKQRVAEALSEAGIEVTKLGAMYIGTIHAYCERLLREMDAKYRQFDVLDDNRLILFLVSRFYDLGLQDVQASRGARYFETVRQVELAWKTLNDEMLDIGAVRQEDPDLGSVLARLRDSLNASQFIDFSLMIRLVVEALQRGDSAALEAIGDLDYLIVDEYQDVNPSQEALIQNLHSNSTTLIVVGDDDQAIYGWRGADVRNIIEFSNRFPSASTHTLSRNFRSTEPIVSAADKFAAAELGATRLTKNPQAENNFSPRDFRNLWFDTRDDEAEWVAKRITSLLGTEYVEPDGTVRGLTPGDFAILMRSTRQDERDGSQRHTAFTQALEASGIPYTLEAGGGVFERPQVRVLQQTFELLRSGSPTREQAQSHFDSLVVPVFPSADFGSLAAVLAKWGTEIHTPPGGARRRVYPQQLVHDLLEAFAIDRTTVDPATMSDLGVFSAIVQDVEAVYVSIDSPGRYAQMLNFLSNVAESGYDTSTDDILRRPDAVTVSTVHRVKGLEFPCVFVVDVEGQRFPGRQRQYQGWLPSGALQSALARGAYRGSAAEEARLFYTAMTRAERYLYVSGSGQLPGGKQARRPSRFAARLDHPEISDDPLGLPAGLKPSTPIPRVDETVMPTSYSDIRYYLRCPKDYELRKRFGFSPPIPDMFGFGMTVHASIGKLHELFRKAAPSGSEAEQVARENFHVKHVPPSGDPKNRPGAYERGQDRAGEIVRSYAEDFASDFVRLRQVEAPFEIPAENTVIAGSIDLLLREDKQGNILDAEVIDFKAMAGGEYPEESEDLEWTELALQVQLYARAATQVLGENTRTGAVHLLKDSSRIQIPITDDAVAAAIENVEWAVRRILEADFPMRPEAEKCDACDFKALCPKSAQAFQTTETPPAIHVPGAEGTRMARSFSQFDLDA